MKIVFWFATSKFYYGLKHHSLQKQPSFFDPSLSGVRWEGCLQFTAKNSILIKQICPTCGHKCWSVQLVLWYGEHWKLSPKQIRRLLVVVCVTSDWLTYMMLTVCDICTLPFSVRLHVLDLFVASLVFMKSTSCCVIRENFKYSQAVRPCYSKFFRGYRSAWFPPVFNMSLCGFWHLCNLPLIILAHFYCKIYMYSLQVFAFEGQNIKFTINMLLSSVYIVTPGLAVIRFVCEHRK